MSDPSSKTSGDGAILVAQKSAVGKQRSYRFFNETSATTPQVSRDRATNLPEPLKL